MEEQKGKILIASSLLLTVLAGTILLLFVLPGITGSTRSEAQAPGDVAPPGGPGSPPAAGAPGGGSPPGGPGSPPGGGPGSPPGGGPGSPPGGGPGGPGGPGGMAGGPGGPGGMPGGPGGAPGGAPGAGAAAAGPTDQRPLEGYRPNPFVARGETVPEGGVMAEPPMTYAYGTNWHRLPITARLGFVRPAIPARTAAQPPAPTEAPSFDITVTSILWTQDGQAMAVYESGGKSGVVKPGDIVNDWQVVEIWRDRIIVADKKSGGQQSVYITTKSAAPSRPAGGGGGATPGGGRRGRPQGGGNPPGGMPPPAVR